MLIVFTGNGKGKTSAALGVALRSLGWNKKVAIIQFIKGNKEIGEWQAVESLKLKVESRIDIFQFFDDKKYAITEKIITENPEYKKSCEQAWEFAKDIIKNKKYELIILDEINNALHYKLLNEKDVLSFVGAHCDAPELDIIMTGRDSSQKIIDIADLVTEMNEIKHPFQKGITAKKGIDF
jgi:cob(I)alamin adenosyltransferase